MNHIDNYPNFKSILEGRDQIVYLFGTGISAALTGERYSWGKWINDGIALLKTNPSTETAGTALESQLNASSSAANMIALAGDVIKATKSAGLYDNWMHSSFESNSITNKELSKTLHQLTIPNDLIATTDYDDLLEQSTGLNRLTYADPAEAFTMLEAGNNNSVLHIHGAYDSSIGLDNIIAGQEQYDGILSDKGAQFIQNILATKSIIFVGCGKTSEDANIAQFMQFAKRCLKLDRPYFFVCRDGEDPDGLPANTAVITYGSDYSDLTPFLKEIADTRLTAFLLNNPIIGRNAYISEPSDHYGLAEYHFMQENIPFCGRENELKALKQFLNNKEQNLWWIIGGQAGSGKSRLALELLKELNNSDWFGFFLNKQATSEDINSFRPFKNTLIIIDYVAGREQQIAAAIIGLYHVFDKHKDFKLRILFIEREEKVGLDSWIDAVEEGLDKSDAAKFSDNEYISSSGSREPLYLLDMDDASVEKLIGCICLKHGLPDDVLRNKDLREDYHAKFEMLHYRPLFVELYVKAWIDNDCVNPRYDTFKDLLKVVLKREQERWLQLCNSDINVCNAWIGLVVLASCIGSANVKDLEGEYRSDWETIQTFIKSHTFPGDQRKESLQALIVSMCQSVDGSSDTDVITPLYPDILKEFMLLYYMDSTQRIALANYLWGRHPQNFFIFIRRAISDFPYDERLFEVVDECEQRTTDPYVLITRSQFLTNRVLNVGAGDTPEKILDFVEKEDKFWHDLPCDEDDESKRIELGLAKYNGLILVAEQYGAWSNIPKFMSVAKDALNIPGDDVLKAVQITRTMDLVRNLEEHGFHREAQDLVAEINKRVREVDDSDFEDTYGSEIKLIQMNNDFMDYMLSGKLYDGYEYLKKMRKVFTDDKVEACVHFSQSCRSLGDFGFRLEKKKYIDRARDILKPIYERYISNSHIAANYICIEVQELQYEYFFDSLKARRDDEFVSNLDALNEELDRLEYSEEAGMAWTTINTFRVNFIKNDQTALEKLAHDADAYISEHEDDDAVPQVYTSRT